MKVRQELWPRIAVIYGVLYILVVVTALMIWGL